MMPLMTTSGGRKRQPVTDNLGNSDRQAGLDQRGGNECRDIGNDAYAASHESLSAADSLTRDVEQDDREQQMHPKTGEELGIEVRHPSDGAEAEVNPDK
jgi:hypothetical protein